MASLDTILEEELALLTAKGQWRELAPHAPEDGIYITLGGQKLINFSGNDYFGLASHPEVIEAAIQATWEYGAGATASRLVCGNHPLYETLEHTLAELKGTEASLVFGSGYLANIGVIPALAGKNDLILADRLSHACMLDGARLSGASLMRFAHNSLEHLAMQLEECREDFRRCLILTESVFSMDGDLAPLAKMQALAEKYDAWLLVDDAHGLGWVHLPPLAPPASGRGKETDGNLVQMGTLSKAAGSYGGYVAGSKTLIEYLTNTARSLIFSTGLPPATIAAAVAALTIMQTDRERCQRPLQLARQFTEAVGLPEATSPIVPIILEENDKAIASADALCEAGFYVRAIRPPTVPPGTARLRVTFSALHDESQVTALGEAVKALL